MDFSGILERTTDEAKTLYGELLGFGKDRISSDIKSQWGLEEQDVLNKPASPENVTKEAQPAGIKSTMNNSIPQNIIDAENVKNDNYMIWIIGGFVVVVLGVVVLLKK